jgi:DNA-binding IclR family transcriptional regulator
MSDIDVDGSPSSGLQRAAALMQCFDLNHSELTLSMLTRRSGLPKTTVHRMARQLVGLGWLARQGDAYSIGSALFEMASLAPLRARLREAALPYMQDLYQRGHSSIHLAVREGGQVLYVEKLRGHNDAIVSSRVGGRMPLHCTALGKVLLASATENVQEQVLHGVLVPKTSATIVSPDRLWSELQNVRLNGLGYDRQESALGTQCIAAPIVMHDRRVVAALSISAGSSAVPLDKLTSSLREAAAAVGRELTAQTGSML